MISDVLLPNTPLHKNALEKLGLKPAWIHEIGLRILSEYNRATPHDAINAAGSFAYYAGIRAARDILAPNGWQPLIRDCYELVWQPDRDIAFYSISGNGHVAVSGPGLRTKNPRKGKQVPTLVERNAAQTQFWPELEPDFPKKKSENIPPQTWFLLYYIDEHITNMRMELALPTSMTNDAKHIEGWEKRIFMPPIPFSPAPALPDEDFAPDIEFEIRRKS